MDVFDYGKGNFRKRRKGNVTSTVCCTIVCSTTNAPRRVPLRPPTHPGRPVRVCGVLHFAFAAVDERASSRRLRPRHGGARHHAGAQLRVEHAPRLRPRDLRGVRAKVTGQHDQAAWPGALRVPVPGVRAGHAGPRGFYDHVRRTNRGDGVGMGFLLKGDVLWTCLTTGRVTFESGEKGT